MRAFGVAENPLPRVEGTIPLPDGRSLGYAEFGDEHGVLVLWFHGSPGARRWLHESYRLAAGWRSGGVYQNFPDPDLPDAARAYFGANLHRLRQVKSGYDPDGFFGHL